MPPFLALLLRFRRKTVAAHNTRGDMSIPSTAVLGLSGRGIGAPAFSCTATGEERYFCCTLDRCGLGPAPHTVSPRSGKDPSPLRGPSRVLSLAGPLRHQSGVRPSLCPGPMLQGVSYVHPEHADFVRKSPDMSILPSASLAL